MGRSKKCEGSHFALKKRKQCFSSTPLSLTLVTGGQWEETRQYPLSQLKNLFRIQGGLYSLILPFSVRSVLLSFMNKIDAISFEIVFNDRIGYILFSKFARNQPEPECLLMRFYEDVGELSLCNIFLKDKRLRTAVLFSRTSGQSNANF